MSTQSGSKSGSKIQGEKGPIDMMKFLEKIPLKYREGPWSWGTYFFFLIALVVLYLTQADALESFRQASLPTSFSSSADLTLMYFRLFGFLWGIYIVLYMLRTVGWWPLMSYTVTSWNLMTIHLGTSFLVDLRAAPTGTLPAIIGGDSFPQFLRDADLLMKSATFVSEFTRFPALIGCTITVTIWWCVLVPLIDFMLAKHSTKEGSKDNKYRQGFRNMNKSWLLVNLHGLNLPIAAFEFFRTRHPFQVHDLFFGLLVALCYLVFYLLVLDANGAHFYIILTPRPWWSFLVYLSLLSIYVGVFFGYNSLLQNCFL